MSDASLTAAAVISFSQDLEERSAAFYTQLAERFAEHRKLFQGWAQDCGKTKTQIVRTYQETVTDALETNYSFAGLSLAGYAVDVRLAADASLVQALQVALELETVASALYLDISERSQSLLATIPRAFSRAARTRQRRKQDVQDLLPR